MRIVVSAQSPVTATDKTDLKNALAALAGNVAPSFQQIRAALPAAKQARFTDGFLHQAALDLGLRVDVEG